MTLSGLSVKALTGLHAPRKLALNEGDVLAIESAGAYGFVMAGNYNSRPRPAEVMVDGEHVYVIRQRETFADLIRGESCLPD